MLHRTIVFSAIDLRDNKAVAVCLRLFCPLVIDRCEVLARVATRAVHFQYDIFVVPVDILKKILCDKNLNLRGVQCNAKELRLGDSNNKFQNKSNIHRSPHLFLVLGGLVICNASAKKQQVPPPEILRTDLLCLHLFGFPPQARSTGIYETFLAEKAQPLHMGSASL